MKKVCPKCLRIIEDGVGHADWCPEVLDELKRMLGIDKD